MDDILTFWESCRKSGSYLKNYKGFSPLLMMQEVKKVLSLVSDKEVIVLDEKFSVKEGASQVIKIRFYVKIANEKYPKVDIFSQVLFPPSFGAVPPVFSFINLDETKLEPHERFSEFQLPDRSYEVKLLTSEFWREDLNFHQMLDEFLVVLSKICPLQYSENPKIRTCPTDFEADLNDPRAKFPSRSLRRKPEGLIGIKGHLNLTLETSVPLAGAKISRLRLAKSNSIDLLTSYLKKIGEEYPMVLAHLKDVQQSEARLPMKLARLDDISKHLEEQTEKADEIFNEYVMTSPIFMMGFGPEETKIKEKAKLRSLREVQICLKERAMEDEEELTLYDFSNLVRNMSQIWNEEFAIIGKFS